MIENFRSILVCRLWATYEPRRRVGVCESRDNLKFIDNDSIDCDKFCELTREGWGELNLNFNLFFSNFSFYRFARKFVCFCANNVEKSNFTQVALLARSSSLSRRHVKNRVFRLAGIEFQLHFQTLETLWKMQIWNFVWSYFAFWRGCTCTLHMHFPLPSSLQHAHSA